MKHWRGVVAASVVALILGAALGPCFNWFKYTAGMVAVVAYGMVCRWEGEFLE